MMRVICCSFSQPRRLFLVSANDHLQKPTSSFAIVEDLCCNKDRIGKVSFEHYPKGYCPLWAWLHSHQPARFCFWELTKQLPRVVTHPGIAPASHSLNFGVLTTPKPVSSQKVSCYEDARCAI
ncbi:hypothetical protein L3X38_010485 [Prunus dulcis]|uniref:Uncharacterized protein n=1 Tax=Prunus dulcis TaxID=3755 RepID=A0AAD4ZE26_PRUDU|nr:hypothetical protein L3X38_010485 [Prunus dulcis]